MFLTDLKCHLYHTLNSHIYVVEFIPIYSLFSTIDSSIYIHAPVPLCSDSCSCIVYFGVRLDYSLNLPQTLSDTLQTLSESEDRR